MREKRCEKDVMRKPLFNVIKFKVIFLLHWPCQLPLKSILDVLYELVLIKVYFL